MNVVELVDMSETVKIIDTQPVDEFCGTRNRRISRERRSLSLHSAFCSTYKGRRGVPQRLDDRHRPHYVDVYDVRLLLVAILITMFCVADAYFTLIILSKGGSELNPIMNSLLAISSKTFFIVKYLATAAGLCLAVLHINFNLFRRIPMRKVLNFLCCLYIALIVYEITLLSL